MDLGTPASISQNTYTFGHRSINFGHRSSNMKYRSPKAKKLTNLVLGTERRLEAPDLPGYVNNSK